MEKIICRLKGGLGNQLFCYAAAKRLAVINNADLVLDHVSGFKRDLLYKREYQLDKFNISARKSTKAEQLKPFERLRRAGMKYWASFQDFENRSYLEEESLDFDPRLLNIKLKKTTYLDGYWQNELYFKDIEDIIRNEFSLTSPLDIQNAEVLNRLLNTNSIALHVRNFEKIIGAHSNLISDYYHKAVDYMDSILTDPHYYIFSDDLHEFDLGFFEGRHTIIDINTLPAKQHLDLYLMSNCKHVITANSTFSWWAAWLCSNPDKVIIAPSKGNIGLNSWTYSASIPAGWIQL